MSLTTETKTSALEGHYVFTIQLFIQELNLKVYVFNSDMFKKYVSKKRIIPTIAKEFKTHGVCDEVFYADLIDPSSQAIHRILHIVYKRRHRPCPEHVNLILFYAINDLFPCFGYSNCITPLLRGKTGLKNNEYLAKVRNVSGLLRTSYKGKNCTFHIFDVSGLGPSRSSLLNLANSFGVPMKNKKSLDNFKEDMSEALFHPDQNIRLLYGRYGMDDAVTLVTIKEKSLQNVNNILKHSLNFDDQFLFHKDTCFSTVGKTIAVCFQNHIYNHASTQLKGDLSRFLWATTRHGYLAHKTSITYDYALKQREKLISDPSYLSFINPAHFSNYNYFWDALNFASVPVQKICCASPVTFGVRCSYEHLTPKVTGEATPHKSNTEGDRFVKVKGYL